jgi:ribonuclease HII
VAVAGVDEVGRGALAGPVSAGACVLGAAAVRDAGAYVRWLNDSKQLSARRREEVAGVLREVAQSYSVAHVAPEVIDSEGLMVALRRAMTEAVAGLDVVPDVVALDGRPLGLFAHEDAIVKGDGKVACIAAASVLAKVERDALMVAYAQDYPGYGFEGHKGYGSSAHIECLTKQGLSPLHRRSFCQNFFQQKLF